MAKKKRVGSVKKTKQPSAQVGGQATSITWKPFQTPSAQSTRRCFDGEGRSILKPSMSKRQLGK